MEKKIEQAILDAQKGEIEQHLIYKKLAKSAKDVHNRKVLESIAVEELDHYDFWKKYSLKEIKPQRLVL